MLCYESSEHSRLTAIAVALMIVWPIGCIVLYAALLGASRHAIQERTPSRLSLACAFLHAEYEEPVRRERFRT